MQCGVLFLTKQKKEAAQLQGCNNSRKVQYLTRQPVLSKEVFILGRSTTVWNNLQLTAKQKVLHAVTNLMDVIVP